VNSPVHRAVWFPDIPFESIHERPQAWGRRHALPCAGGDSEFVASTRGFAATSTVSWAEMHNGWPAAIYGHNDGQETCASKNAELILVFRQFLIETLMETIFPACIPREDRHFVQTDKAFLIAKPMRKAAWTKPFAANGPPSPRPPIPRRSRFIQQTKARHYRTGDFSLLSAVSTFSLALTGTRRACSTCPIRSRLQCVFYPEFLLPGSSGGPRQLHRSFVAS
jgi:hypothetical protein